MAKYSRSFKILLAQECLNGVTAHQLSRQHNISKSMIRYWRMLYQTNAERSFLPPDQPYTADDKATILSRMWSENWSITYTAAFYNLPSPGTLSLWLREFDQYGLPGLHPKRKGRPPMKTQKSPPIDKAIEEMTPDELRREVEYRRAEVAVLKKLEALAASKRQQAGKKRRSSKR